MRSSVVKAAAIVALVAIVPVQSLATEPFAKVGTYSLQFLKIGVSARGIGMGGAFTAIADDASATYWNPAGMVDVTRTKGASCIFGPAALAHALGRLVGWER